MSQPLTHKLSTHFNKVLPKYARYNSVFSEIGRRLLVRCEDLTLAPKKILDLGYGLGTDTHALQTRFPNAAIYGLDLAWHLPHKHPLLACGDAHALPFQNNSIDLIFINGPLYWSHSPQTILQECHRVLSPNGSLLFTALGPDTFIELGNSLDPIPLHDLHLYGDWLVNSAFLSPVMDRENLQLTYPNPWAQKRESYAFGLHFFTPETAYTPQTTLSLELLYGYAVKPASIHQHAIQWQDT